MRQAQNGKHTSCASASTSGQLHQEKDCSKCAQRARTASAAAANSGTQGREVRREASSGPALGAKCRGCGPRLQERVLKILLSPLKKGSKIVFFSPAARISRGARCARPKLATLAVTIIPVTLRGSSTPQGAGLYLIGGHPGVSRGPETGRQIPTYPEPTRPLAPRAIPTYPKPG